MVKGILPKVSSSRTLLECGTGDGLVARFLNLQECHVKWIAMKTRKE